MDKNPPGDSSDKAPRVQLPQFLGNKSPRFHRAGPRQHIQSAQVPQTNNQIRASINQAPRSVNIGKKYLRSAQIMENLTRDMRFLSTGNMGQEIDLVANYFPIKACTNWMLYMYSINFSPEISNMRVKRCLLFQHRDILGAYLFGEPMLFSCTKYDSKIFTLSSKCDLNDQIVTITVTFISALESNDYLMSTQVLYLLMFRNSLRHLELTMVDENHYDPAAQVNFPEHKLQLWPGYNTNMGLFDGGLFLRTEISTKIMRDECVLDFFHDCIKNDRVNYMDNFKAGVKGAVVLTRYNNHTYRIYDVNENSSPRDKFEIKDGKPITYIDYYKEKWNIIVREDNQPLMISKKKNLTSYDDDTIICLLPELCSFTGFTDTMRKNSTLMKDLAEYINVNPMERIKKYNDFMNRFQSVPESVKALKNWNLNIQDDLVKIKGRVFHQQKVFCNDKTYYDSGVEADWTTNICSFPMFTSANLQRWVVLYPNQNENDVRTFIKTIRQVGDNMSFIIPQPEFYPMNMDAISSYPIALEQVINQLNPSFILCVTQSQRCDVYNLIKRHLCVKRAVPSQVVLLTNVRKNDVSVCTKIAIQINCKLGGAPWKISIPTTGIMIIGIDVHNDKQNKITYGALIASINNDHTKFYSKVYPHRYEELEYSFTSSVSGALLAFRKLNQTLPTMIVVYRIVRDENCFVYRTEIRLVKNALKKVYGQRLDPPMAYISVDKRTSTKFFRAPQGSPVSNPPPGTVVDSVITDPTKYDFYLVSQNMKLGSVTPTYYNVLEDNLPSWSPDRMQLLTYKLTYNYYNWSGTIQFPAHCQLAQKLAFFASQTLQSTPNDALNELLYFL